MRDAATGRGLRTRAGSGPAVAATLGETLTATIPGLAREAATIATHLAAYPLGALPGSAQRSLSRRGNARDSSQRGLLRHDPGAATTPILLVHGIVDNHSIFTRLDHTLRRRGFATVAAYDYGPFTRDVAGAAERFGSAVRSLATATGHDRVHVVGHSLGGLIARWFVQRQGGDDVVDTLVTLGTPHAGTELARLAPLVPLLPMARQLTPDSPVITALAEPAPGCRTHFVAYASDIDHLVVPHRHARLEHPDLEATNVEVHGVGHLSMPNDRGICFEIADALAAASREAGSDVRTSPRRAPRKPVRA